jgi:hypothetical protein
MSKYTPLENYLQSVQKNKITLTFKEVAEILNSDLPASAFEYPQWWENDSYHVQSKAWKNAGWKTEPADIHKKIATFVKL